MKKHETFQEHSEDDLRVFFIYLCTDRSYYNNYWQRIWTGVTTVRGTTSILDVHWRKTRLEFKMSKSWNVRAEEALICTL
jgi:hypothetical protein